MSRKEFERADLGGGYYLEYRMVLNGLGGYHPVNMMLYKDDAFFIRELTDSLGNFLDFPGVAEGAWTEELHIRYYTCMQFLWTVHRFQDGLAQFGWMVQPDGRYWEDEDGFGGEDDREIWLYSLLDREGTFTVPFSERRPGEK